MVHLLLGAAARGIGSLAVKGAVGGAKLAGRGGLAGAKMAGKAIKQSIKKKREAGKAEKETNQNVGAPKSGNTEETTADKSPIASASPKAHVKAKSGIASAPAVDKKAAEPDDGKNNGNDLYGKLTSFIGAGNLKLSKKIEEVKGVTGENLKVNKDSLEVQKDSKEFAEEQAYKAEHDYKDKIKGGLKRGAGYVKDKAIGMGKGVMAGATRLNNKTGGGGILGMIGKLFAGAALVKIMWPQIKKGLGKLLKVIEEKGPALLEGLWKMLKDLANSVFEGIIKYGPIVLEKLTKGLLGLASYLLGAIEKYGPEFLEKAVGALGDLIGNVIQFIIDEGPGILLTIGKLVWSLAKSLVPAILKLGVRVVGMVVGAVWDMVTYIPKKIFGLYASAWDMIKSAVWDLISGPVEKLAELGSDVWATITKPFNDFIDKIVGFVGGIWDTIKAGLISATSWIPFGGAEKLAEMLESGKEKPAAAVSSSSADMSGSSSVSGDKASVGSAVGDMLGGFFADGGFTGKGEDDEVAGIVHKNEFVLSKDMLQEISDATDDSKKDALVKKAAGGKGDEAEAAIRKAVDDMKPSNFSISYNGLEVRLTEGQKREFNAADKSIRHDKTKDRREKRSDRRSLMRSTIANNQQEEKNDNVKISVPKKGLAKAANLKKETPKEENPYAEMFAYIDDIKVLEGRKKFYKKGLKFKGTRGKRNQLKIDAIDDRIAEIEEYKKVREDNAKPGVVISKGMSSDVQSPEQKGILDSIWDGIKDAGKEIADDPSTLITKYNPTAFALSGISSVWEGIFGGDEEKGSSKSMVSSPKSNEKSIAKKSSTKSTSDITKDNKGDSEEFEKIKKNSADVIKTMKDAEIDGKHILHYKETIKNDIYDERTKTLDKVKLDELSEYFANEVKYKDDKSKEKVFSKLESVGVKRSLLLGQLSDMMENLGIDGNISQIGQAEQMKIAQGEAANLPKESLAKKDKSVKSSSLNKKAGDTDKKDAELYKDMMNAGPEIVSLLKESGASEKDIDWIGNKLPDILVDGKLDKDKLTEISDYLDKVEFKPEDKEKGKKAKEKLFTLVEKVGIKKPALLAQIESMMEMLGIKGSISQIGEAEQAKLGLGGDAANIQKDSSLGDIKAPEMKGNQETGSVLSKVQAVSKNYRRDIGINGDTKILAGNNTPSVAKSEVPSSQPVTNINTPQAAPENEINLQNTGFEDDILRYVGKIY